MYLVGNLDSWIVVENKYHLKLNEHTDGIYTVAITEESLTICIVMMLKY